MRAKLDRIREAISASLWFTPALLVILACGLAALTLLIDEREPPLLGLRPWLFGGTAGAARDLLAAVAGSLITVVALAFSVTIVAIQQAATQFSPRVIRNFMRDRGNQVVFGTYIATFVYALLVLRQVREDRAGTSEFVPALSVTAALLLALLCVGLLIYFIHHTATSLQVATIADNIRRELRAGIDRLYPQSIAEPLESAAVGPAPTLPRALPTLTMRAPEAGYLRGLDADQLLAALPTGVTAARVYPEVGDYVIEGAVLLELWATAPPAESEVAKLAGAFALARERSNWQDLRFGIRQLVDIALKALSPGINDPTTAEQCLALLGDVVARLAERRFPAAWRRTGDGGAAILVAQPDFAALVAEAFGQIRREAARDVHVTGYLLGVLGQVARRARTPEQIVAIRHEVDEVLAALGQQLFTPGDTALIRRQAQDVLGLLVAASAAG